DAQAGADRSAQGHYGGASGVGELAGQDRVVVGVGQHGETVGDELFGGLQQLDRIGQQGAVIGDNLEFDPGSPQRLAAQSRGEHGFGGAAAASSVGQR